MDTEERVTRLEETVRHHRELSDWRLHDHNRRLSALEEKEPDQIVSSSGLKLLIAVIITLLAFLVTGDPRSAFTAARLGLGLP
jgi:hypothetical protein